MIRFSYHLFCKRISFFLEMKMKRYLLFVLMVPLFVLIESSINHNGEIIEEVEPIRENEIITGFQMLYTIPKDYHKKQIILEPKILEGITHYKTSGTFDSLFVNIIIDNQSRYSYEYVENSFSSTSQEIPYVFKINLPFHYRVMLDFTKWNRLHKPKDVMKGSYQLIFLRKGKK